MTTETREYIRRALQQAKGDDLERANVHFGRMNEQQLDQQYRYSGQTCREIWDGYKADRAKHDAAMREFDALP